MMDESRRLAMRRKHADRGHQCGFCGRVSFGNGGKVAHARSHVRKGEAVELVKYYSLELCNSRVFLVPDDPRIDEWIREGFQRVEVAGVASTEPGEQR